MSDAPLYATDGPYSVTEVLGLVGLRDLEVLARWRKAGTGPPFLRIGRKGARVLYPRAAFWAWIESRTREARRIPKGRALRGRRDTASVFLGPRRDSFATKRISLVGVDKG